MKKTWSSTLWRVSGLVLLSACGGSVEAEPPEAGAAGASATVEVPSNVCSRLVARSCNARTAWGLRPRISATSTAGIPLSRSSMT